MQTRVQDHGFARVGTMQVQAIMPPLLKDSMETSAPLPLPVTVCESLEVTSEGMDVTALAWLPAGGLGNSGSVHFGTE